MSSVTRYYIPWRNLSSGGPVPAPVNVARAPNWVGATSREYALLTAKGGGDTALDSTLSTPSSQGDFPRGSRYCLAQAVGEPLQPGLIAGTFRGVFSVFMGTPNSNEWSYLTATVRVVSGDGTTVRGTLVEDARAATRTPATSTPTARTIGPVPMTPVTALAGDRIVVEVGIYRGTEYTGAVVRPTRMEIGDPTNVDDLDFTDLAQPTRAPWVEITFDEPGPDPDPDPPPLPVARVETLRPAKALLRVGGEWVHTHAHYGDLEVTDRADGGVWSLSWSMNLPAGEHMPWLAPGVRVELYAGSLRWSGTMADPDWDGGRFTADGWCRQAESAYAMAHGAATNDPNEAILRAYLSGSIRWQNRAALTPLPDAAREINSLVALLDQWGIENSRRWGVNEHQWLTATVDPTTPTMWVLPGIVDLSASTVLQADHVMAEYLTTGLTRASVEKGTPIRRRERLVSLEDLGPISAGRAQTIVDEIYRRSGGGKPIFTTGFEVSLGQVVDRFGPVDLSLIRPGRMIRIHGCDDPRTGAPYTDLVIGETVWRPQEGRVQVNPVDMDAADFESIVEELGGTVVF